MRAFLAVLVLCAVSAMSGMAAHAEDPVQTTQSMIEEQIRAFLKDDADTAYSFAAPGIKAMYPDKNVFFAMVKKSYEPVYHPGNYAFGRNRSIDDGAMVYQGSVDLRPRWQGLDGNLSGRPPAGWKLQDQRRADRPKCRQQGHLIRRVRDIAPRPFLCRLGHEIGEPALGDRRADAAASAPGSRRDCSRSAASRRGSRSHAPDGADRRGE